MKQLDVDVSSPENIMTFWPLTLSRVTFDPTHMNFILVSFFSSGLFYLVTFFLVTYPNRQTDARRHIWAHSAGAQMGWKIILALYFSLQISYLLVTIRERFSPSHGDGPYFYTCRYEVLYMWKGHVWSIAQKSMLQIQRSKIFHTLKCFLGHPQYIVWSTRSSDIEKLCPTRKKKGHFNIFLFFPPTCQKNKDFFFKMCTNHVEFDHFSYKNQLSLLFFIFSSDIGQKANFIFYFFSSDGVKKHLSDLVDQTIYCGCP